jgi:hypothetical protein
MADMRTFSFAFGFIATTNLWREAVAFYTTLGLDEKRTNTLSLCINCCL